MSYRYFNPNPDGKKVGDCVIRAIGFLTGQDWTETYLGITLPAFGNKILKDERWKLQ